MRDKWVPENSEIFSAYLKERRATREKMKAETKSQSRKRKALSSEEREIVLKKTERKCHVCGGPIDGYWEADHVLAHSGGGDNSVDNYLPANVKIETDSKEKALLEIKKQLSHFIKNEAAEYLSHWKGNKNTVNCPVRAD